MHCGNAKVNVSREQIVIEGVMSPIGTKRTSKNCARMSAIGATADKGRFWQGTVCPLMTDTVDKVGDKTVRALICSFAGHWITAPVGGAMTLLAGPTP